MKRKLMQLSMLCLIGLSVTACETTGLVVSLNNCLGAIRLTEAQIEALPSEEAARILKHNEREEAKGCAVPNS